MPLLRSDLVEVAPIMGSSGLTVMRGCSGCMSALLERLDYQENPVSAQPTPWKKNTFVPMGYETHAICVS